MSYTGVLCTLAPDTFHAGPLPSCNILTIRGRYHTFSCKIIQESKDATKRQSWDNSAQSSLSVMERHICLRLQIMMLDTHCQFWSERCIISLIQEQESKWQGAWLNGSMCYATESSLATHVWEFLACLCCFWSCSKECHGPAESFGQAL